MKYFLNGFGYENTGDYMRTMCGIYLQGNGLDWKLLIVAAIGTLRFILVNYVGFDIPVFIAFVLLIVAEFWTGVKVARTVKNEKFQSRKFGRMIFKIGTYVIIVAVLNVFAKSIDAPDIMGISLNPFTWLYFTVFTAIVFQLLISWLENLGMLGYKESKTIAGFILRKFNKWFEFDGSKNNDKAE